MGVAVCECRVSCVFVGVGVGVGCFSYSLLSGSTCMCVCACNGQILRRSVCSIYMGVYHDKAKNNITDMEKRKKKI